MDKLYIVNITRKAYQSQPTNSTEKLSKDKELIQPLPNIYASGNRSVSNSEIDSHQAKMTNCSQLPRQSNTTVLVKQVPLVKQASNKTMPGISPVNSTLQSTSIYTKKENNPLPSTIPKYSVVTNLETLIKSYNIQVNPSNPMLSDQQIIEIDENDISYYAIYKERVAKGNWVCKHTSTCPNDVTYTAQGT